MEGPASNYADDSLVREEPPSYSASTAPSVLQPPGITVQQTVQNVTTVERDSANNGSKEPSSFHPSSTPAVLYPASSSHTERVTVVTSQPQYTTHQSSHVNLKTAEKTVWASIFFCVVCCLCGSPLTLICFLPAIMASTAAKNYAADGEGEKAKNSLVLAYILIALGILVGISIPVIFIVLRAMAANEANTDNQTGRQ